MFSKRAIQNIEALVWYQVSSDSNIRNTQKLTSQAQRLASGITRLNKKGCSIDLLYAFRSFTLDTIMSFTLGNCVDALDTPAFVDPLIVGMDTSMKTIPLLRNFPLIGKIIHSIPPSLIMKTLPDAERVAPRIYSVQAMMEEQLHAVMQNPGKLDEAPHQTFFHRMLNAEDHGHKTVPNPTSLHDEGMTLIFAGSNAVADTLFMGHWNILNQPELFARLKSEMLTVWPNTDVPPSLRDLETLPLLTATIKESLRHIPSGTSFTRVVPPAGATISGQRISGGTTVGMVIMHVHLSDEVFEDTLAFKPDRWLGKDAGELEQWLVSFSRGPRMCPGVKLAWAELYITFATMIRGFDMELDGTTTEDMEWRECIVAYYPKRHLHAWCRPATS